MKAFLKAIYRKVLAAALASAAALLLTLGNIVVPVVPPEVALVVQAVAPILAGYFVRESKALDPDVKL